MGLKLVEQGQNALRAELRSSSRSAAKTFESFHQQAFNAVSSSDMRMRAGSGMAPS